MDVDRPPELNVLATDADVRAALDGAGGDGVTDRVSQSMAAMLESSR